MTSNLGAFCEYVKGKVPVSELTETTYISTENMLPNKAGITTANSLPTVDLTQAYCKGDVLVSNIRPYFKKIWQAKYDGGCSNDVLVFRAKDGIDQDFLYYILADDKFFEYAMATSKGTKMPRGDKTSIMQYRVPCFDLATQKKIASLLRSIDEKIEINTAINNNLEQQATTMFRRFYDSSNNTVPFTSMIRVLGGGTPKTGEPSFWNGTIPFFTPKDVGSPYSFNTEKTITEEGLNHCNSRLYPQNTVFVTARGTVGKVSMAGLPMAMNQSCYALVGINIDQILAYHYTLVTVNKLKHKATGAVFDAIITKDFETESISRLTDKDAEDFLAVAKPIYSAILTNSLENQRLISLRDTLLPRLMSSKLDLSDVDF